MRPSIKLYDINTVLHKAFILCICIFLIKDFVVIGNYYKGRNLYVSDPVAPLPTSRWRGIFWGTLKWEQNKSEPVVGWNVLPNIITLTRSVKFSALSLSAFCWAPIFVTFSPAYITAPTSWVRSVSFEFEIGKFFSLPIFAKTQVSTKRWVWD